MVVSITPGCVTPFRYDNSLIQFLEFCSSSSAVSTPLDFSTFSSDYNPKTLIYLIRISCDIPTPSQNTPTTKFQCGKCCVQGGMQCSFFATLL